MPSSTGARRLTLLFALYFAVWWLASLPAVSQYWLSTDDYDTAIHYRWWHNYIHGRPFANVVMRTLPLDAGEFGTVSNLGLRWVQGALHTGVALIAALLLYKRTRARAALVAPVVFLLWPYNGEATLWRNAGAIPISAILSAAGALIVSEGMEGRHRWLAPVGALLVAVAVLFQQLGAVAGLVLWAMVLALQARPAQGRDLVGAVWLGGGYSAGALISHAIARAHLGDLQGRDQLTTDPWGKVDYLSRLWRDLVWPPFSAAQRYVQVAMLVLLVMALMIYLLASAEPLRARALRIGALASLVVLPYAPALISSSSPTAVRMLYMGPLLLVTACLATALVLDPLLNTSSVGVILAGALAVVYLPMAMLNAADYPAIYRADLQALAAIRAGISASDPTQPTNLVVADLTQYLRAYDPHGVVRVFNSESKLSAFMLSWSARALIEWKSDMTPLTDADTVRACSTACAAAAAQSGVKSPFKILPLEEHTYCLCP